MQCNFCNKKVTYEFTETGTMELLLFFIKAVVFHNVYLSWIILTKDQYKFVVEEHLIEWCTGGPLFNDFLWNLHGPKFEELFVTSCQDRYDILCGLHAYDKDNDRSTDAKKFGGVITIPYDSTTIYIFLFV